MLDHNRLVSFKVFVELVYFLIFFIEFARQVFEQMLRLIAGRFFALIGLFIRIV